MANLDLFMKNQQKVLQKSNIKLLNPFSLNKSKGNQKCIYLNFALYEVIFFQIGYFNK